MVSIILRKVRTSFSNDFGNKDLHGAGAPTIQHERGVNYPQKSDYYVTEKTTQRSK